MPIDSRTSKGSDQNAVLFPMGRGVMTRGVQSLCRLTPELPFLLLRRHASGDWGDLCPGDKALNRKALLDGSRIFSAYEIEGRRFYVITESDRAVTTVLLADEY